MAGFVKQAAEAGIDIFRIFDSRNYAPNGEKSPWMWCKRDACHRRRPRFDGHGRDILDPVRREIASASFIKYYAKLAKELSCMWAYNVLGASGDMAWIESVRLLLMRWSGALKEEINNGNVDC